MLVNVEAGENPQFKLQRISRGNENTFRDNELRDEITVRLNNLLPNTPIGIDLETPQNPEFITLTASDFTDSDGDEAMAACLLYTSDAADVTP